jgi:hypothetical protein
VQGNLWNFRTQMRHQVKDKVANNILSSTLQECLRIFPGVFVMYFNEYGDHQVSRLPSLLVALFLKK